MEKFVAEVILPLLATEHRNSQSTLELELRAFVKGETSVLTKEIAKKSKELFVATSDIENIKEALNIAQTVKHDLAKEISNKNALISRQITQYEGEISDLKRDIEQLTKEKKALVARMEQEIQKIKELHSDSLAELRAQQRKEMETALEAEKKTWEEKVERMTVEAQERITEAVKVHGKEKSKLIRDYESKLQILQEEAEKAMEDYVRGSEERLNKMKLAQSQTDSKLELECATTKRLRIDLKKETDHHQRYREMYEKESAGKAAQEATAYEDKKKLTEALDSAEQALRRLTHQSTTTIASLRRELDETTRRKDNLLTETVEELETKRTIEVDTLRMILLEEKEIAVNAAEVRAYEQNYQATKRYEALQRDTENMKNEYTALKRSFELQVADMNREHEVFAESLKRRQQYESALSDENAKREYSTLLVKSSLQISSLRAEHSRETERLQLKAQEERVSAVNKLIAQYEAMIVDLRANNEVQIKQKVLQFERKSKGYEKRLVQSQKRRSEAKIALERQKIEAQMKIESMVEVNERLEAEIEELQQRVGDVERSKETQSNDYQFQLLTTRNEMQKMAEKHYVLEESLRGQLNEELIRKNKEIARFAEKLRIETEELVIRNKSRVALLEKEYEELKRVINQKTSLPQDIQALKLFHGAYLEKEQDLASEQMRREKVQRQLEARDAVDRIFQAKGFRRITRSLSSLSLDLQNSQLFQNELRRNSFDVVNMFKDSDQFPRKQFKYSLDLLQSNIASNKPLLPVPKYPLQLTDDDKLRLERAGVEPLQIGEAHSQSEYYEEEEEEEEDSQVKLEPGVSEEYQLNEYLLPELAVILQEREIPWEYVRGLLLVNEHPKIKSVRRMKVERYLQKRRNKTWNRKICYNCRQKVAEERLRIKGKFIKKRRAMEILGLTVPVSVGELKKRLERLLVDKNQAEIEEIIKKEE